MVFHGMVIHFICSLNHGDLGYFAHFIITKSASLNILVHVSPVDMGVNISLGSCWVWGCVLICSLTRYCQVAPLIGTFLRQMFTEHLLCIEPRCDSRAGRAISFKVRSRGKRERTWGDGSKQLLRICGDPQEEVSGGLQHVTLRQMMGGGRYLLLS